MNNLIKKLNSSVSVEDINQARQNLQAFSRGGSHQGHRVMISWETMNKSK